MTDQQLKRRVKRLDRRIRKAERKGKTDRVERLSGRRERAQAMLDDPIVGVEHVLFDEHGAGARKPNPLPVPKPMSAAEKEIHDLTPHGPTVRNLQSHQGPQCTAQIHHRTSAGYSSSRG